jgi:hypothetical protein
LRHNTPEKIVVASEIHIAQSSQVGYSLLVKTFQVIREITFQKFALNSEQIRAERIDIPAVNNGGDPTGYRPFEHGLICAQAAVKVGGVKNLQVRQTP